LPSSSQSSPRSGGRVPIPLLGSLILDKCGEDDGEDSTHADLC
jgi:hypothetical protein